MRHKALLRGALAALATVGAGAMVGIGLAAPGAGATPSPTLYSIRAAHHPGYDRIVFTFDTTVPTKHTVGYVAKVVTDPKGSPVTMTGNYYLEIHLFPTTTHNAKGPLTPAVIHPGLPNVREIARIGDFEGYLTFAVGLDQHVPVRVFTLTGPSRVVVDVPVLAWPTLSAGSRGPDVTAAQYLLRSHGYPIVADGIFGTRTGAAVTAFQRAHKLVVDGVVGARTWTALFTAVGVGARGDLVRALQVELTRDGLAVVVDGVFGPRTFAAVKAWQSQQWLPADGVVGAATWTSLVRHVSAS